MSERFCPFADDSLKHKLTTWPHLRSYFSPEIDYLPYLAQRREFLAATDLWDLALFHLLWIKKPLYFSELT